MKRLYLLRHAKAVPGAPDTEDYDRALSLRGMHDADALGGYLHRGEMLPDLVLVSSAVRTTQTAELVLREIADRKAGTPKVDYHETLYLAEPGTILAMIQAAPAAIGAVMVIGHNPGIEMLAGLLAREPVRRKERARHDVLEEKFPTAALAVLDFQVTRWRDIAPGEGRLTDFVRPRDI